MTAALATCNHTANGADRNVHTPAMSVAINMSVEHEPPEYHASPLLLSELDSLGAAKLAVWEALLGLC